MNLASLIKNDFQATATATSATPATHGVFEEARTVAEVASVAVATARNEKIIWQSFVDECILMGVTADEVAAMFSKSDIEDLCDEPADKLPLHAGTIADAIKCARPIVRLQAPVKPAKKRCIDCQHFSRTDHPHIGRCQAGEPMGSSGNWDNDSRDRRLALFTHVRNWTFRPDATCELNFYQKACK